MIEKIKPNLFKLKFQEFGSNVYLLNLQDKLILIDTSSEENQEELIEDLSELNLTPKEISTIILTHSHWDHQGNLELFKKANIISFKNFKELKIPELRIILTPGHTKDSLCILYKQVLFSGDTIFENEGAGRTDLPESEPEKMEESLVRLDKLDYEILCPGH